jgi:hypothetical protein
MFQILMETKKLPTMKNTNLLLLFCLFIFTSLKGYSTTYNATNTVYICSSTASYDPFEIYRICGFSDPVSYFDIDEYSIFVDGSWENFQDENAYIQQTKYENATQLTIQWKNTRFLAQNDFYYVTVQVRQASDEHFHLPNEICAGQQIDLHDFTSIPHTGLFSTTSTPNYITALSNDELFVPPSTAPVSYNVTWSIEKGGLAFRDDPAEVCYFDYSKTIQIREKPVITWATQFPTSNQILDSDIAPITLNGSSTAGGVMTYNGAGVSNGAITPSNAGYGTHTLTAFATTQYGCTDTTTQTIEITHDAGTPEAPQLRPPSSGIITSQDFYFSQLTPTGYAPNQQYSQEYNEMHVCDGQTITISVGNPTQVSLDSIRYIYNNNGIYDTIGTYKLDNSTISYNIPHTGLARTDYIISQFKTNLGVYGSSGNTPVFVTAVEPITPLSTLVCDDEFNFYVIEQDQGVQYQPFIRPYQNGTLNGGNDWMDNYTTYTTRLTDLNNNNLAYTINNTNGLYLLQAPKTKTITRTVSTKVPYNSNGNNDTYALVSNPQTCRFTDTIVISRKPIIDYIYTGDSVIIGGTTVTINDNSQLNDYTTFDFFNNKGGQQGTSITDTLYSGQGNVLITAYDTLGCSSDSLVNLVAVTDNPSIGLLDNQTSGLIYPVANGLIALSGGTDSLNSEMHVCDGQTITLQIDVNRLAYNNGIDSVKYFYYANGSYDTIGKFGINETASYTIPTTNNKRIDSVYTQLFTVLDYAGEIMVSPLFISHSIQRQATTQVLNCDTSLTYSDFIGQGTQDYDGLMHWSYQGTNADFTTFETVFKDVYGQILFNSGVLFTHDLLSSEKSDTIFKREITKLPFRSTSNNAYYNAIANPQTCVYDDTIVIVRPPIASFTHNAQPQIEAGTPIRHISTSQYTDSVTWDYSSSTFTYYGDTSWYYLYQIGSNDVTITAFDDFGCVDSLTEYGYTSVIDWTGIEEQQNTISEVLSYPNPMQDNLTLKITSAEEIEATIFILDMSGRVVLEKTIYLVNSENIEKLDVSMLTSGFYNCQIVGKNINIAQKLIKK